MKKEDIIKLLEAEYWLPMVHVTNLEYETSKLLNKIIDTIIEKVKNYETDN